jgi:modification methylase
MTSSSLLVPHPAFGSLSHNLHLGDARNLAWIPDESVHLVVTSPPYWTLKEYNHTPGQLGDVGDYHDFLDGLDEVWKHCARVLVPGGRIVCNVGDVSLSRKKHKRHRVVPLHADITVRVVEMGLDHLSPIYWYKIGNANYEVGRAGVYGKPYEPNGVIKNEIEYLLMFRKPGAYRKPTDLQRSLSRLSREEYDAWFRPIWSDIRGASLRSHPAPFPPELAYRLIRMFSFAGDTVLDPFAGTCSTGLAAINAGRASILNELDPDYLAYGSDRLMGYIQKLGLGAAP